MSVRVAVVCPSERDTCCISGLVHLEIGLLQPYRTLSAHSWPQLTLSTQLLNSCHINCLSIFIFVVLLIFIVGALLIFMGLENVIQFVALTLIEAPINPNLAGPIGPSRDEWGNWVDGIGILDPPGSGKL